MHLCSACATWNITKIKTLRFIRRYIQECSQWPYSNRKTWKQPKCPPTIAWRNNGGTLTINYDYVKLTWVKLVSLISKFWGSVNDWHMDQCTDGKRPTQMQLAPTHRLITWIEWKGKEGSVSFFGGASFFTIALGHFFSIPEQTIQASDTGPLWRFNSEFQDFQLHYWILHAVYSWSVLIFSASGSPGGEWDSSASDPVSLLNKFLCYIDFVPLEASNTASQQVKETSKPKIATYNSMDGSWMHRKPDLGPESTCYLIPHVWAAETRETSYNTRWEGEHHQGWAVWVGKLMWEETKDSPSGN